MVIFLTWKYYRTAHAHAVRLTLSTPLLGCYRNNPLLLQENDSLLNDGRSTLPASPLLHVGSSYCQSTYHRTARLVIQIIWKWPLTSYVSTRKTVNLIVLLYFTLCMRTLHTTYAGIDPVHRSQTTFAAVYLTVGDSRAVVSVELLQSSFLYFLPFIFFYAVTSHVHVIYILCTAQTLFLTTIWFLTQLCFTTK